jgi:hypothetical protein
MKKIDMSSAAITRRLRQTEQLRRLSLSLMKARPMTEKDAEARGREKTEPGPAGDADRGPAYEK